MNGDGKISRAEMQSYLTAVFRVVVETEPRVAQSVTMSPDQLAAATTDLCFADADADHDGFLSEEASHAYMPCHMHARHYAGSPSTFLFRS